MCIDIAKSLFRNLPSEGVVLSEADAKTLWATYLQTAHDAISRYQDDAAINSLAFDRHEERTAVGVFLKGLKLATDAFLEDPLWVPILPNWSRVAAAVPDIFDRLIDAVEQDHAWTLNPRTLRSDDDSGPRLPDTPNRNRRAGDRPGRSAGRNSSYNNADTIGHVVRAVSAGLGKILSPSPRRAG